MSTTIFTAKPPSPEKERRKRQIIIAVICVAVIAGSLYYGLRNWPYEHRVNRFFDALEVKDYKAAYGIWFNDPNWQQHPQQYSQYTYDDFYRDWGPGGEWGVIKSHDIVGSARPKHGSGIIVVVRINGRVEPARLWVEKKTRTLTWSPY